MHGLFFESDICSLNSLYCFLSVIVLMRMLRCADKTEPLLCFGGQTGSFLSLGSIFTLKFPFLTFYNESCCNL